MVAPRLTPRVAWSLVLGACLLRFATLGYHSVWLDEAFDIWAATQHTADHIWNTRLDPNLPQLYYWLLHHVLAVLGDSAAAARLPSAVASILGIGLVFALGRVLAPGTVVGRFAAVLLALSPLDFWYAQEARMHGMVAPAGVLFALGLFRDRWWSVPLTVAGLAFGLSLDHTMWPVAIVVVSWWLVARRGIPAIGSLARTAVGISVALWIYSPWWYQAQDVYSRLNTVPFFVNLRSAMGVENLVLVPLPALLAALVVVFSLVGAAIVRMVRAAAWQPRVRVLVVAAFVIGTVLAAVPRAYGLKQILVGFGPLATLGGAWALTSEKDDHRPWAWATVALSILALATTFATPKADWRGVARHLSSLHSSARPIIVLDPGYNQLPFHYYVPSYPVVSGPVVSLEPLAAAARENRDVCLVSERFGKPAPTSPSEAWLDENLHLTRAQPFARLELRCYKVR